MGLSTALCLCWEVSNFLDLSDFSGSSLLGYYQRTKRSTLFQPTSEITVRYENQT
jgi:hypothetical protein